MRPLHVWDLDRALTPDKWAAQWDKLRREGSDTTETRVTRRDGSVIDVEVMMSRLDFRGEEVAFMLLHDVTERNRIAGALVEERNRFELYSRLSTDIIWETDAEFRFKSLYAHDMPWFERIALGKRVWELPLVGVTDEQVDAMKANLIAGRPFRDFTFGVALEDKSILWTSSSGVALTDASGARTGYIGITHDITRDRDAQEREKVQLAAFADHREFVSIGMMSATILHEIKHEIGHAVQRTGILGREVGKAKFVSQEAVQRHLGFLDRSFNIVVSMLDGVKDWLQEDKDWTRTAVSLQESAKRVRFFKADILSEAKVSIQTRNLTMSVLAVPEDVVHVLVNLTQNAADAIIHANAGDPRIVIGAALLDDGWVDITVEDNGCGFDAASAAFAATPGATQKPGGWGRGLDICRWIISRYDGARFWIDSKAGEGTVAHFTLPVAPAEAAGEPALDPVAEAVQG